jgi:hypothetical protein
VPRFSSLKGIGSGRGRGRSEHRFLAEQNHALGFVCFVPAADRAAKGPRKSHRRGDDGGHHTRDADDSQKEHDNDLPIFDRAFLGPHGFGGSTHPGKPPAAEGGNDGPHTSCLVARTPFWRARIRHSRTVDCRGDRVHCVAPGICAPRRERVPLVSVVTLFRKVSAPFAVARRRCGLAGAARPARSGDVDKDGPAVKALRSREALGDGVGRRRPIMGDSSAAPLKSQRARQRSSGRSTALPVEGAVGHVGSGSPPTAECTTLD